MFRFVANVVLVKTKHPIPVIFFSLIFFYDRIINIKTDKENLGSNKYSKIAIAKVTKWIHGFNIYGSRITGSGGIGMHFLGMPPEGTGSKNCRQSRVCHGPGPDFYFIF